MDTQTKREMASETALSRLAKSRRAAGAKQIRKAVMSGAAQEVFLAVNADPAITEPIEALCRQHAVPCIWVRSMADLGKVCDIEVGAAAAAATK